MTAPAFRQAWSEEAIRALGTRTDVPTAGAILGGLSATQAYQLHKAGRFPVPTIEVGRRIVVPVSHILAALGLAPTGPGHREHAADQPTRGEVEQAGNVRQLRSGGHAAT